MKKTFIVLLAVLIAVCSLALLTACGEHKHAYSEFVPEVAATCQSDGVIGHYNCTGCSLYFDENYAEISSVVIPKTNHTYGSFVAETDSSCSQEGCPLAQHTQQGFRS